MKHEHAHDGTGGRGHSHGLVDPWIVRSREGVKAVSISLVVLLATTSLDVFSLGNSSDVFLILRAHDLGLSATLVILAYALYNLVYSALSWPLGALSDRIARTSVLAAGLAVFALVYLGFALAPGTWAVWPLFAVYGVYIAATEGVAKAWVADYVPPGAAGTAYGLFAAASGGMLVASVVAGLLWSRVSPEAPFLLGAATAVCALLLILSHPGHPSPSAHREQTAKRRPAGS